MRRKAKDYSFLKSKGIAYVTGKWKGKEQQEDVLDRVPREKREYTQNEIIELTPKGHFTNLWVQENLERGHSSKGSYQL